MGLSSRSRLECGFAHLAGGSALGSALGPPASTSAPAVSGYRAASGPSPATPISVVARAEAQAVVEDEQPTARPRPRSRRENESFTKLSEKQISRR